MKWLLPKYGTHSVLPGFGLTLGINVLYLSVVVLLPLAALLLTLTDTTFAMVYETVWSERALAALRITFSISLLAAFINLFLGLLIAWVLVRYRFPGRIVVDALIDLPFALPTAVAGIALTAVYSKHGFLGALLAQWGLPVAYTPLGIFIALLFITLPFVVRTLQPALLELEAEVEEAALTLGASAFQTLRLIIIPSLMPYLITSFSLAFARGLGEYGSVVFISGNLPKKTEIVSFLIMTKLEQFDYRGATILASVMLLTSFLLLFVVNSLPGLLIRRRSQ